MELPLSKDISDKKNLEKFSSAFTLSDMEIFIFPELFYPLILADIMSPELWKWREDPWFKDIEKKSFTVKANRIKQYIIQNYVFNLDLSTWGLTSKSTEIARFSDFFDMEMLKQSNALFGYEGDKYYFDIDIRKHFGLDKYDSDIIPYWKTETIEAMGAFRYKESFKSGAGECVSLSALYASAMFVVGRVPLEKIFLIATPLHSQNFIIEKDGLITNNRRIVTKNMWYNGTSLSDKARRAMENEKVTIVSHISGYIHTLYKNATIDKKDYQFFSFKLKDFLSTELTSLIFINFLRFKSKYKNIFQYRCDCEGMKRYITLEKLFEYEHSSKFNVSAESRGSLVKEIESDDFHLSPIEWKIMLNDIESILDKHKGRSLAEIENEFIQKTGTEFENIIKEMFIELSGFLSINPKIPDSDKNFILSDRLDITTDSSREAITDLIKSQRDNSETALLALYVYRQMDMIDWHPFVKASIERNPVSFTDLYEKNNYEVYSLLKELPIDSIYDGNRLALPDEVWNFKRGDGIEKAFMLADFILHKDKSSSVSITIDGNQVLLSSGGHDFHFISKKNLKKSIQIKGKDYKIA
ncbi:MAG TPA: hypothetical protein VFE71_05690 [Bacteroidales bacterium]|nr:hypothetical protein [Bacteroidales bacterium]